MKKLSIILCALILASCSSQPNKVSCEDKATAKSQRVDENGQWTPLHKNNSRNN